MSTDQVIAAISALAKVVEANRGLVASESTMNTANKKIKDLINHYHLDTE